MSDNKSGYELRWEILKEMISIIKDEWFIKKDIAEKNSEKSSLPIKYLGDIPLEEAIKKANLVYETFVCKK